MVPKKVLFCATVVSHLKAFHLPYLRWFREQGWEVHAATYGTEAVPYVDKQFNIPIQRSPFKLDNWRAYRQLKDIVRENNYEIIHCHTPMGGALTRLAARQVRRTGTRVLYTAHGFHFFKGASFQNWLLYYPVEKYLSRYTDCLITMNAEDYNRALDHQFKAGAIAYVHGVGIDFDKYKPVHEQEKRQLREWHGIGSDEFVMIYAAELSQRKNQAYLLKVVSLLRERIPRLRLLLAGQGALEEKYREQAGQLGLENLVTFLGHRTDMDQIYALADIAVSSSRQEGLPVNIMEAIATGLPVVATDVRGNRDLVEPGTHGFLVGLDEPSVFADRIWELYNHPQLRADIRANRDRLISLYSVSHVLEEVKPIYTDTARQWDIKERGPGHKKDSTYPYSEREIGK
ncbi:glycosyltransferase family 4 protein [Paenibacillus sp. GM2]|uniref:glycosyltransferase family 4 protein n=1 Tax=Paenibacillus sp. GM2 TaxID=1622070 RepID=UPI0009ED15B4|nr:glycosyltransferase family 4 protein [Paenibacillus sp. GM2]